MIRPQLHSSSVDGTARHGARRWVAHPILWILLVALMLRVAAAVTLGGEVTGLSGANDEISYSMLGHRYAEGHGLTFPSNWYPWIKADRPQSYFSAAMSLTLAGIYSVVGYQPLIARLVMAALGTAVVWLIYLVSRQTFGEPVALVSAAVAAVYSYLVFYSVTLVTETPFILAVLSAIYLATSVARAPAAWKWIALGVVLAAAVLFRVAALFFVPPLLLWIVWGRPKERLYALIPVVCIALSLLPFSVRNHRLWGEFLLSEAQFGHVFWNGNHPGHQGNFHPFVVFEIPDKVLVLDNDALITKELLRRGIENVRHDPGHFALLTLTRLRELFKFWPTEDSSALSNLLRVMSFGIMWPFALAGVIVSWRRWRELTPMMLFMLTHIGVYAVTWTMIRYRIPVDAVLIPFAAVAVVRIYERFQKQAPVSEQWRPVVSAGSAP
jgi:4-amino-4-deoxy-L-arabinose transferase-like glycosyltransferase